MSTIKPIKPITPEHIEAFKKEFDIKQDAKKLLKDIVKIDKSNNLKELFYEYFFDSNDKIQGLAKDMYRSFDDNNIFKIVHGYSKNGKTTFVNYLEHCHKYDKKQLEYSPENFEHLVFIPFDFEHPSSVSFTEKVREYYDRVFFVAQDINKRITLNKEIELFCLFIKCFLDKLLVEEREEQLMAVKQTFETIVDDFQRYIAEIKNYGKTHEVNRLKNEFLTNIKGKINAKNCGEYFSFIIFFEMFKTRNSLLSREKHKFVIILDNIDDYLKDEDVSFLQHPQIRLSTLLYVLSTSRISGIFRECVAQYNCNSCINKLCSCSTKLNPEKAAFNFEQHVAVIYVFRTANFLVFANLIEQLSKEASDTGAERFAQLLKESDKEYFHFKSAGNTSDILKLRLDRFKEIAKACGLLSPNKPAPAGYTFLKVLAENFDSKEKLNNDRNIDRIYNLWNGDKFAFWKLITTNWENLSSIYFENEKFLKSNCKRDSDGYSHYKYLLRGVYINFFLNLLNRDKKLREYLLKHAIRSFSKYSNVGTEFNNDDTKLDNNGKYQYKKRLCRLMSNYIINGTLRNGREENTDTSGKTNLKKPILEEIHSKGVGLYDLLYDIENFINEVNEKSKYGEIYNFSEVEEFFKELYDMKIDHFGQLFSIYKDQRVGKNEENEEYKYTRSYYNLDKEIATYKETKEKSKKELNKIRIFNNNNVAYISASLLSNYELHSYLNKINLDEEKNKNNSVPIPLLFQLCKDDTKTDTDIVKNFKFYKTIEDVLIHTKNLVTAMANFYCDILSNVCSPDEFIESDLFFVKDKKEIGDFQFRLIVSNHITYLQDFRQLALNYYPNDCIPLTEEEKKAINEYLVKTIVEYCKLYCQNYEKIKAKVGEIGSHRDLTSSYRKFRKFEKIGNKIIEGNDLSNFKTFDKLNDKNYLGS